MKQLFIFLIFILTITMLYGYYQFSNKMYDGVKEGLESNNTNTNTNTNNNNSSKNLIKLSILTEIEFINYITQMNSFLSIQQYNIETVKINNTIKSNIDAIILISNYANILNGITVQTFNKLKDTYPNFITNMYDVQKLNELYYSSISMSQCIIKLPEKTNLIDPTNIIIYNSLLGHLNVYSNSITYFYNMLKLDDTQKNKNKTTQDDYNTKKYDSLETNVSVPMTIA